MCWLKSAFGRPSLRHRRRLLLVCRHRPLIADFLRLRHALSPSLSFLAARLIKVPTIISVCWWSALTYEPLSSRSIFMADSPTRPWRNTSSAKTWTRQGRERGRLSTFKYTTRRQAGEPPFSHLGDRDDAAEPDTACASWYLLSANCVGHHAAPSRGHTPGNCSACSPAG